MKNAFVSGKKPRVIIIGAGFGGLAAAKSLANSHAHVTVLDRSNHHLFQPLLYQVATASLSPGQIAQPIRFILNDAANIEVVWTNVEKIDIANRRVVTRERDFEYDFLIVATGARQSYFGHDDWEKFAPGLKSVNDAVEIRRRILIAFEIAERTMSLEERKSALTFVIVGAGPTGVEMAGAIAEIAHHTLVKDFHHIDTAKEARIVLLDGASRVLQTFDESLSAKALEQLQKLNVEVRLGKIVSNVDETGVEFDGEKIRANTVIWAAGNNASPLAKQLGVETDRAGRAVVEADLSIKDHPEVFVIGDVANFSHQGGKPLPGVSPVAMQQGRHAAYNILAAIRGKISKPFHYVDKGSLATIGRNKAVAQIGFAKFSGILAWLAWLFIHIFFLVGFRNRIAVFFIWASSYFSFSKGSRLITSEDRKIKPLVPTPPPKQS